MVSGAESTELLSTSQGAGQVMPCQSRLSGNNTNIAGIATTWQVSVMTWDMLTHKELGLYDCCRYSLLHHMLHFGA
jgi:hypothetical protein